MVRRIGYLVSVTIAVGLIAAATDARAQKSKLGKPETGVGTTTAARKYLEGRWGLVSFDVMPPGKPVVHLGGQGSLTYDGFGNMKWEVRIPPDAVEPLRLAGIPSNNGVVSMSGRTAIDMQAHTLSYTVQGQPPLGAPSGPLALNRKRHWEVDGNLLTLTTKADDGTPLSVAKWRKVEAAATP